MVKPVKLTPTQAAQKKYKASAKGRAAQARARATQRAKADFRAKETARVKRWIEANSLRFRVYRRVYMRRLRRERQAQTA